MKKRPTYSAILERGGKVSWPKALTDWKIGQRVFLSIHDGAIASAANSAAKISQLPDSYQVAQN